MNRKDITREQLYESVKQLIESTDAHIHLGQQKLFTLFSIGFQYFLYQSTKNPGAYIIRIEDSSLADKLTRKAKDDVSRKFLQKMLLQRRLKYQKSTFYVDFFHLGSWAITNDIPKERIKGALVVKNTTSKPMEGEFSEKTEEAETMNQDLNLPENYFYTSLQDFVPKTIVVAYEHEFDNVTRMDFPFIKSEGPKALSGVRIASDVTLDKV